MEVGFTLTGSRELATIREIPGKAADGLIFCGLWAAAIMVRVTILFGIGARGNITSMLFSVS